MNMELYPESKSLKMALLKADGLFDTFIDVASIIPITPFDYREVHRVLSFVSLICFGSV